MSGALKLAEALIGRRSITPDDAGCQQLLAERLAPLGFRCESLLSGDTTNLWALCPGQAAGPTLVFAGHTDVVPPGPLEQWHSDPFVPTGRDGRLYGRGAADMKSSIAAFVVAVEELFAGGQPWRGRIGLLITSDEEGPATDGTVKVVEALRARGEKLDYCIIGEPTSVDTLGDTIKNGRRGSLSGRLTVRGIQGHVAYPQLARNPVHLLAPVLARLAATEWDAGNAHFPPTTWQVSNIRAGTGAGNVIPGEIVVDFNFRFSTASTVDGLKARVAALLDEGGLDWDIAWSVQGQPFLTPHGELCQALADAIRAETGVETRLSTSGGTSDGRFIASICPQVAELGPCNASVHKIDEFILAADIERLKNIYRRALEVLLK
ncbi:MAG: succinyl-diaminopimelate desuccinylase [Burkholderiaceae bacterium]